MHRGYRVVAWTPFGRERTCSLLLAYMARDHQRGIVDEYWLCMNTQDDDPHQDGDRQWADNVASLLPWVHQKVRPGPARLGGAELPGMPEHWLGGFRNPKQLNTGRFFFYMQEPDTIFVRFDDDILWVHPDAVTNMIDCLLDYRGPKGGDRPLLAVFPVIWNNAVSSWFLQRHGHIPKEWGEVCRNAHQVRGRWEGLSAVDPLGWKDGRFAEKVHGLLLHHLEWPNPDACLTPVVEELGWRQQFSVSCFAIRGQEYVDIGGVMNYDQEEEEHWLTMHQTGVLRRSNAVCGMAHVAHYTFFTQSHYINTSCPEILYRYWKLAEQVKADVDAEVFVGKVGA